MGSIPGGCPSIFSLMQLVSKLIYHQVLYHHAVVSYFHHDIVKVDIRGWMKEAGTKSIPWLLLVHVILGCHVLV